MPIVCKKTNSQSLLIKFILACFLFNIPHLLGAGLNDVLRIDDLIVLDADENNPSPPEMLATYFGEIEKKNYIDRHQKFNQISTVDDYNLYRNEIKKQISACFGDFPTNEITDIKVVDRIQEHGYQIEKIIVASRPGYVVPANVYVPAKKWSPPYPGVISLIGHWEPAILGKAAEDIQARCIGLARRGYVVITFDPIGQGERCFYWDFQKKKSELGMNTNLHAYLNFPLKLTGENLAAWFTWDALCAVDYLLQRGDVDATRIAVTGASGGGNATRFLGAVDSRISALIPTCSMFYRGTQFRVGFSNPDGDQNLPFSLHYGIERLDQLLVNNPQGILLLNASRDKNSVMQAVDAYHEMKDLYDRLDVENSVDLRILGNPHGYNRGFREAMYLWLDKFFGKKELDPTEKEMHFNTLQDLSVSGSTIYKAFNSKTEFAINGKKAKQIIPQIPNIHSLGQTEKYQKNIINSIKKVCQLEDNIHIPESISINSKIVGNTQIDKLLLQADGNIQLPAVIMKPVLENEKCTGLLYLHERGKVNGIKTLQKLMNSQMVIMALDVRGYKEEPNVFPGLKKMPNIDKYQFIWEKNGDGLLTAESYELGLSLFGQRVGDVIRGVKYLSSLPNVDSKNIIVFGEGDDALLALHAGLLEQSVQTVVMNNFLGSWYSLTQTDYYCHSPFIFVPDILKYYDVPHVAVAMAPKKLIMSNPVNATKQRENVTDYKNNYRQIEQTYGNLGQSDNLIISDFTIDELVDYVKNKS